MKLFARASVACSLLLASALGQTPPEINPAGNLGSTPDHSSGDDPGSYFDQTKTIGLAAYTPNGALTFGDSPILELTPDIVELANGLNNDPVRIYNFVRNEIESELYFGLKKGPRMTLLEKSGNDLDKAFLLASLLRCGNPSADLRIAVGTQAIPYYSTDENTPDICSLWQLEPSAMEVDFRGGTSLNPQQYYEEHTRYLHPKISALNGTGSWSNADWRRVSLAFTYAAQCGYSNQERLNVPTGNQSLTITRFYLKASGLPGSGAVVLDPWAVRYARTTKLSFADQFWSDADLDSVVPGTVNPNNLWVPASSAHRQWYVGGWSSNPTPFYAGGLKKFLDDKAGALIATYKSTLPSVDQVLGRRRMVKKYATSLTAANVSGTFETSTSSIANETCWVSSKLCWRLKAKWGEQAEKLIWFPTLAGRRISAHMSGAYKLSLQVENHLFGSDFTTSEIAEHPIPYSGGYGAALQSSVLLPFVDSVPNPTTVTYEFNYEAAEQDRASHALVYSFSPSGGLLRARQARLDEILQNAERKFPGSVTGPNIDWPKLPDREDRRPIILETLNVAALDWLTQTHFARQAAGDVFGVNLGKLYSLGRMSKVSGYFLDVYQQQSACISRDGNFNEVGGEMAGNYAAMLLESGLEHSIIEQANDRSQIYSGEVWRPEAASTVNILHKAAKETIYNTPVFGVIVKQSGTSTAPPQGQVDALQIAGAFDGFFNEYVTLIGGASWAPPPVGLAVFKGLSSFATLPGGMGWVEFPGSAYLSPHAVKMTTGSAHGGCSPLALPLEPCFIQESDSSNPGYFDFGSALKLFETSQASYGMLELFGADPVNVANGSFEHAEEDLVLGSGEAPMGLSFKRDYASARSRFDVAALGFGWTHNWDVRITEHTDAMSALGQTTPRHMASLAVALHILEKNLVPPRWQRTGDTTTAFEGYYKGSINPKRWMVANAVAKWFVDSITNNAMTVTLGRESETFVKNPSGGFEASSGSTMTLDVTANGVATLKQRHGNTIEFTGLHASTWGYRRGRASTITGPHGQSVTLTWGADGITQVESVAGGVSRKLVFTYASSGSKHLQRVDEVVAGAVNRSIVLSHSEGNLVSAIDPENYSPSQTSMSGGVTTYAYQAGGGYGEKCCLSAIWDPMGRQVVWNDYDAFCRVTKQDSGVIETYASGGSSLLAKPWKFRYSGIATEEEDPLGGVKLYEYDGRGRLVAQTDAIGKKTSNSYDEEDRLIETVDARGARIQTDYDVYHNPLETREFRTAGAATPYKTTYTYDTLHRPLTVTDANGRVTTMVYPAGSTTPDPESVTKGGKTVTYVYEPSGFLKGLPKQEVDEDGTMVTKEYTAQGYLFREILPGNFVTEYGNWTPSGDAGKVTDPAGKVSNFTFNKRRQVTGHTKADPVNPGYSLIESSLYDACGRLAYEATETGRAGGKKVRTFEYLSSGKPTYTRYGGADGLMWTPDDTFELNLYDEREWVVKSFDVNGNATQFTYLANGWSDVAHLPDDPKLGSRSTSAQYDDGGRTTASFDVLNRQTSTAYAEHVADSGVVTGPTDKTTVTDPAGFTSTEWKDPMGNLRVLADRRGKKYRMDYDTWDRVTRTTTPSGRYFESTYRADGRVATATKGLGSTTVPLANTYDTSTRRLFSVSWPNAGKTVNYSNYDANGNLLTASESGKTITRTYDHFDRVKTYKNADGWTLGYEYYNDGMLKRVYYPDSATDTNPFDNDSVLYDYDQQGRLKTITDWAGRVTTYYWRTDGRLRSIARPNGTVRQLHYDAVSRVVGFTERDASGNIIHLQRLDYRKTDDLASSFTHPVAPSSGGSVPVSINSALYGDDNEMSSVTSSAGSHTLETDERGNLKKAVLDGSGALATLSFDERDRLTGIDSTVDTSFTYDLEGNRISMTHGGATTNYVFDPHGGSLVRMLVRIDSTGKKTRYVYGVGLDYEVDQTTGQAKYYHYDFTGGTAAITNQAGTVTDRYFYTPYGQVKHATGTTDTPFKFGGFMGVITDPNGLLSMRARFYSPILCRFVSMDPAKFEGGMNWYAYATGNPLTLGDPTGFGPESTLDAIQTGLSVLGMMPVVGFAFDLVNAGISVMRGNYGDAMLNMFSAIPGIGDLAGASKLGAGAMKMMDAGMDMGRASHGFAATKMPAAGIPGICFVGGTEIETQNGATPIEGLRVGDRVSTSDGNSYTEVSPINWRKITLRMPNPECPSDLIDLELLRSDEWMASTGCSSGSRIWLELEEMGLRGWADVIGVGECPTIQSGLGRVVLATVTHLNTFVMEVRLEGQVAPLRPTDRHRLFSVTRNDWVPTASLQAGEVLRTADGTTRIASVQPWPGTHRVFNIEVETEHSYFAGKSKVLSHNTNPCAMPLSAPSGGIGANSTAGRAREAYVQTKLEGKFNKASVQRESYLRNADGTRAKDPLTGTARRIDHVVVENGQVRHMVETTSKTADKSAQISKEARIRANGGTFIRDRDTGGLIDISGVPTRLSRRR